MSHYVLIDEGTREVIETGSGYKYAAKERAQKLVSESARSILICMVEARVSSALKLELDSTDYPTAPFGEPEPQTEQAA